MMQESVLARLRKYEKWIKDSAYHAQGSDDFWKGLRAGYNIALENFERHFPELRSPVELAECKKEDKAAP